MSLTWISLLPPLVVIGAVCITQQLNISLAIGILVAALIATQGQIMPALILCAQKGIAHFSDIDNIYLYCLLIVISSLITLLTVTGSAAGCAFIIGKKMRTKRSVEMSTILLSFLLCIDDYLSILTVGFVMKPIADKLGATLAQLALAWAAKNPNVSTVITGASRSSQLRRVPAQQASGAQRIPK